MNKQVEQIKAEIERRIKEYKAKYPKDTGGYWLDEEVEALHCAEEYERFLIFIDNLEEEPVDMGEVSDGYHTFNELYYYRMLYNAAFFNALPKHMVHKSKRHHTGEECFGGGWFIVMANLPTGQISNHYELKDWRLFNIPEKEFADEWDGHTPKQAAERLQKFLETEEPVSKFDSCSQEGDKIVTNEDGTRFNVSQLERVAVSEELEEAAKQHATEVDFAGNVTIIGNEVDAFKAGANWQKE